MAGVERSEPPGSLPYGGLATLDSHPSFGFFCHKKRYSIHE